jgi:hypothetical protein
MCNNSIIRPQSIEVVVDTGEQLLQLYDVKIVTYTWPEVPSMDVMI